jgi:hypothetical protein
MDHVFLGARELSGTRATASASSFTALSKLVCELLSRNRFFLSDVLFRQEPHNAARKVAADYGLHKATWANAG